MTSALAEETIRALEKAYPFLESEVLTTTAYGRPVLALKIGQGERQVLFTAAHHANEWITATVLLKFAEDLARAIQENGTIYGVPARTIDRHVTVHLVPMVNPDGVDLVTGRYAPGSEEYLSARSLNTDLPFKKTGIAHLACPLICRGDHEGHLAALDAIPQAELDRLFTKAAALGVGIEINAGDFLFADEEAEHVLRIFRTAKACGCKFYLASDAHGRESFAVVDGLFNRAIDLLDLQESDKFIPARS